MLFKYKYVTKREENPNFRKLNDTNDTEEGVNLTSPAAAKGVSEFRIISQINISIQEVILLIWIIALLIEEIRQVKIK